MNRKKEPLRESVKLQWEKFLQFDWLSVVVNSVKFEMPTCENYKPFAGSSINK